MSVPSVLRLIGDPGDRKTQHEDISSHYGFRFVLTLHPHSNEIKKRKKPYLALQGFGILIFAHFLFKLLFRAARTSSISPVSL